jgi:hypothetical protein
LLVSCNKNHCMLLARLFFLRMILKIRTSRMRAARKGWPQVPVAWLVSMLSLLVVCFDCHVSPEVCNLDSWCNQYWPITKEVGCKVSSTTQRLGSCGGVLADRVHRVDKLSTVVGSLPTGLPSMLSQSQEAAVPAVEVKCDFP